MLGGFFRKSEDLTFLEHLEPILLFGRIFANIFFPYKVANIVCAVPSTVVNLMCGCGVVVQFYKANYDDDDNIVGATDLMTICLYVTSSFAKIAHNILRRRSYGNLLLKIQEVNVRLNKRVQPYPSVYRVALYGFLGSAILLANNIYTFILNDLETVNAISHIFFILHSQLSFTNYFIMYHVSQEIRKQFGFINAELKSAGPNFPIGRIDGLVRLHLGAGRVANRSTAFFGPLVLLELISKFIGVIDWLYFMSSCVATHGKCSNALTMTNSSIWVFTSMVYFAFTVKIWADISKEVLLTNKPSMCLIQSKMQTFLDHIRPILFAAKFLGLIYFSLKESGSLDFLCYLPLPIFYAKLCYVSLMQYYQVSYKNRTTLLKTGDTLMMFASMLGTILKSAYYFARRKTYRRIIFEVHWCNENKRRIYPNVYKSGLAMFLFSCVVFASDQICLSSEDVYNYPLDFYLATTTVFYTGLLDYFIIYTIVAEARAQLVQLNKQLQGKVEANAVRFAHLRISKTALDANGMFALPTMIFAGLFLIMMINSCSFMASSVRSLFVGEGVNLPMLVYTAYSLLLCTGFFSGIIWIWDRTSAEAHKTATYIHDIWNNLASRNEIDNTTKHLQLISLQLYNSRLNFTAYGFFPLDWTLLHKIVGAVTTYVVILIQFEISSSTKNSS